jgi:GTP-binding protein Era
MTQRAGSAAIVGRSNVGKSTLLNRLVGVKVAAVSPRSQTTRHRIVGIRSLPAAQVVFLDTPGLHAARSLLNRRMVEVARQVVTEADVLLLVLDASTGIIAADRAVVAELPQRPLLVVLNKMDRVRRPALLPMMAAAAALLPRAEVIPASALSGDNVDTVLTAVVAALPEGPPLYPVEDYTVESERFLAEEAVREQLFLQIAQEVPYGTTVAVEEFTDKPERDLAVIRATILVDQPSHKAIIIGRGGERLRAIGQGARLVLEEMLGKRLFLELFVRVEPGWAKDPRRLSELGL